MTVARRILANLDCEDEWAGRLGARGKGRRQAAVLGTLLRAAAREDDVLWTLAPVDPSIVPDVPGLPRPRLESGPIARLPSASSTLAWGATRGSASRDRHGIPRAVEIDATRPLHELAWAFPPSHPAVAARVNRRDFCLDVARSLGVALPGAAWVDSVAALDACAAAFDGRFVLKGALSAAGRERMLLDRAQLEAAPTRARAEALLAKNGALLAEPWLDRVDDFGALAFVDDRAVHPIGTHRQVVAAPLGAFRGIELARAGRDHPDLAEPERRSLGTVVESVGARLRDAGYRGPFGVDAWRWRGSDGEVHLNPLGEVNARLTMGFVARMLLERIPPAALPGVRITLRVGASSDRSDRSDRPGRPAAGLLLVADAPDGAAAWIESGA